MNPSVSTYYQHELVALSFALAAIGSFVALTAATRIRRHAGRFDFIANAVAAGVALGGIGVWSMHFVGMLALKLDVASSYGLVETGVSLVAAIAATSLALVFVSAAPKQFPRILGAGTLLGLGVVFMHYLGMYGMKIGGYIQWDYGVVGLSAVIAVAAAIAALWLAFNTVGWPLRVLASLTMAVAVCAMHYTGMSAAEFICTTPNRNAAVQGALTISSLGLAPLVVFVAVGMIIIISLDQGLQRLQKRTYHSPT